MVAFLAAGCILAIAGIWLMLKETASGEAAKIAVGPMEVQSASVGFSVFLVGASAFTTPIVAPETTQALIERLTLVRSAGLAEISASEQRAPAAALPAGLVPSDPEPDNDRRDGAAPVQAGDLAGGRHAGENADWFRLDTADLGDRRIAVEISERTGDCFAHFYDGGQAYMGLVSLVPGRNQFELDVNANASFWVHLACLRPGVDDPYHVSFQPIPERPVAQEAG
jgi:hypothetical protein